MVAAVTETVAETPSRRVLVVFDYDLSLVNEDCDVFFLQQLCPELLAEVAASLKGSTPPTWPGLVDEILGDFARRLPHVTRDEITQTVAKIPVSPKMLEAVKLAVEQHNATVVIVSDANEVFIQSMLDHHGITKYFAEVHTNRAVWQQEAGATTHRLRLHPYHPLESEPHGCELCPTNMCKGRIVDAIRQKGEYDLVLYVGDGTGDFCPSTRLTSNDTVFARAHGADGKSYGLLEKIETHPAKVQARVVQWSTGDDILGHFQKTLGGKTV